MFRFSTFPAIVCITLASTAVPAQEKIIGDPGPQLPNAAASQDVASQAFPMVRQGDRQTKLTDRPQKVLFVKSQATTAKAAIGNLLLSDVGLNLITMALAPQMKMWNPYMNDSIRKGIDLGKGMLVGHGIDTKGFEYDTLPGLSADVTLKEGTAEFLLPLNAYVPSADFDAASSQPVLLKLETRDRDNARLIASRQVLLKQNKTSRFDLKPTIERQESGVEQNIVPVSIERLPGNVIKVIPTAPLAPGEYALIVRKASESGQFAQNVALKPTPSAPPPANAIQPQSALFGGMMGNPPQQSAPQPVRSPFGMLRRGNAPPVTSPNQTAPVVEPGTVGFIAWDFRVLKAE